jgi:hypothetical protein
MIREGLCAAYPTTHAPGPCKPWVLPRTWPLKGGKAAEGQMPKRPLY